MIMKKTMCQSVVNKNWIKLSFFLLIIIVQVIKVTQGSFGDNDTNLLNNQTNGSSLLTVHPWLPIGNFTGIIINDNSVNQSYYSYTYIDNGTSEFNQQQQSEDKISDPLGDDLDGDRNPTTSGNDQIEPIYQKIVGLNNYSDNEKVNKVNTNQDESSLSFLDDSPTKEEDYAGGNYGADDDDLIESEGGNGNFASQEDEGLT